MIRQKVEVKGAVDTRSTVRRSVDTRPGDARETICGETG